MQCRPSLSSDPVLFALDRLIVTVLFLELRFFLPACSPVWVNVSVRYSWCLFSSQQASQMASLKVLIDAQCLLIKKLLSLKMMAVHGDRHKHTAAWRQPQRRWLKSKKWQHHQQGRSSISMEDRIKRHVVFVRSLLHAKWKTKPRAWSNPPERTLLFLRLAWNKKFVKGFWSSYDFFLFSPLDSRFDIDHDSVLCSVFSLISGSALRCAAVEQRGCWRLVLVS